MIIDYYEFLHARQTDVGRLGAKVVHHARMSFDSQYYVQARQRQDEETQQALDDRFEKLPLILDDKAAQHVYMLRQHGYFQD